MGVLNQVLENMEERAVEVDFMRLGSLNRRILIENVMRINRRLLRRLIAQIDRVRIELPTVEVRFEKLSVEADAHTGSRGLPTLLNATLNTLEIEGQRKFGYGELFICTCREQKDSQEGSPSRIAFSTMFLSPLIIITLMLQTAASLSFIPFLSPFPAGINALFSHGPRRSAALARVYALWNMTSLINVVMAFICGFVHYKLST